jgi:outer membrane protein OmpA-like peptidoglycan-associated protein
MKRPWIVVLFAVVLLSALILVDYQGYRSLRSMQIKIAALERQANEATRLAIQESAAANAASQRADEAATHARTAAEGRLEAEQLKAEAEHQKKQAIEGRDDAVMAAAHASAQAREAEQKIDAMRQERAEELDRMQQALNRVVETRRTPTGMVIVLPDSNFRFDFDKADLSQKNRELLARIAGILLISKGYGLSVFGYTDDVGSDDYNQQLSLRRAKAVQEYLVRSGIDSSIINVKGFGKSTPFDKGTTAAARARNRRVEIALTDSSIRYGG